MPKLFSGAEIVFKTLEDQKVEFIFGYPGGAVLPIYDELKNHKSIKSEDIIKIVDIELNKFIERMGRQHYTFKFNKNAKEFLAKEGYDQAYGARPIKRAIQKYVEDAVADAILDGMLKEGGTYTVSKDKNEAKLNIK